MGQSLCIHSNMPLDARHLFAGIIAFVSGRIGILDALRVHDAKARQGLALALAAFLRHLIFLMPAIAGFAVHRLPPHSTGRSNTAPSTSTESRLARRARWRHFSIDTGSRKRHHTNPPGADAFYGAPLPARDEELRIALD